MNLPVFCKVLGEIPLHDVDVGSAVLDVINSCIRDEEPRFDFDMSGARMYVLYKSLSPTSRLLLEDLELLSKSEWIALSKQCEMLMAQVQYTTNSKELYVRAGYFFCVAICMLVALFLGIGYLTNLSLRGDAPDSYFLEVLYNLVTFYSDETLQ